MSIPAVKSRMLYPGSSGLVNDPEVITVCGSFETNASADPTNIRGSGFQITWVATGKYNVTFGDLYPGMIACVAGIEADTIDTVENGGVQSNIYVASTGVLQLMTTDGADPGVLTDLDGPRVNFIAKFWRKNTAVVTRTA